MMARSNNGAKANASSNTSAMRTRASRLLSVLVLLAVAWQGPAPCCHCHGTLARPGSLPYSWLAAHLQASHPRTALFGDQFFGWHVHFGSPMAPSGDPAGSSRTEQNRLSTASSSHVIRSIGEAARDGESRLMGATMRASSTRTPQLEWRALGLANRTFFGNFAATLPLPLRFGILRV